MKSTDSIKFYGNMAKSADNPVCVKINPINDHTALDAKFILNYASSDSEVLDLGSGSGLVVNKFYDKVKSIDCVEYFKEFSDFIVKAPNIKIYNSDLVSFRPDKNYDLITAFGIMQYVNKEEAEIIYTYCKNHLKRNGKFIIKNQFGVEEDVVVAGYSEEQKTDYYSDYRYINSEVELLEKLGFNNVEVIDIYPPEANRWNNTHFYAIVTEVC